MRAVMAEGAWKTNCAASEQGLGFCPVKQTVTQPAALAASSPSRMLRLLPEVEMPRATSPGRASASIWRAKTVSNPKSLLCAVRMEVSVVRAMPARARRLAR